MDFLDGKKTETERKYLSEMRPVFLKKALFSDTTANFVDPPEPNPYGQVTIKFRTAKNNVDTVDLVSGQEKYPMHRGESDRSFDYYECTVTLEHTMFEYYFEVHAGKIVCTYDSFGVSKDKVPCHPFKLIPGFHTPEWAKGAVIYQIYVERFCNGDYSNDVEDREYFYVGGVESAKYQYRALMHLAYKAWHVGQ